MTDELEDDFRGEKVTVKCSIEEGSYARVGRIGNKGSTGSRVAIDTVSSEPFETENHYCGTSVMLTPAGARQLAVALIEYADECDGTFTSLITDFAGEDGDDLDAV